MDSLPRNWLPSAESRELQTTTRLVFPKMLRPNRDFSTGTRLTVARKAAKSASPSLDDALGPLPLRACYCLMVGLSRPWPHAWSAARVSSVVGWVRATGISCCDRTASRSVCGSLRRAHSVCDAAPEHAADT